MSLISKASIIKEEQESVINERLNQFKSINDNRSLFKELCYCLLTANYRADRAMMIQEKINDGFIILEEKELVARLKELGYRFYNKRAKYIIRARQYLPELKKIISQFDNPKELRLWLANNIKGLGFKEASHFLRNIGFSELAIIDFHIIDLLEREGLINRPKNLSRKNYLIIEEVLESIAQKLSIGLDELDLILWFMETGTILK